MNRLSWSMTAGSNADDDSGASGGGGEAPASCCAMRPCCLAATWPLTAVAVPAMTAVRPMVLAKGSGATERHDSNPPIHGD